MNILIDIGHPGHVHLLKHTISEIKNNEHKLIVTVKDIPAAVQLLKLYGIDHIVIGEKKDSILGKGLFQLKYNLKLLKLVKKNLIQIGIGTSITIAHVSRISKMQSIILDDDDDEVQPLFAKFAHPYCDYLLSPDALKGNRKRKDTIFYPGYHELAYLHPSRFTPDPNVINEAGLKKNEPFFVMRFNVFKAHHDIGVKGLSLEQKLDLIKMLEPYGKILITTERNIEPELEQYKLKVSPEKIHSLLHYAQMFVGDSQTMTTEAAILGTPALKCNTFAGRLSVPNEIENKYGLCYSYKPEEFHLFKIKIHELVKRKEIKNEWQKKRQFMLSEKIDVSGFLIWFIYNLMDSGTEIEKSPEFFDRFIS